MENDYSSKEKLLFEATEITEDIKKIEKDFNKSVDDLKKIIDRLPSEEFLLNELKKYEKKISK